MNKKLIKNTVKTFGFGTCLLGAYTANADGCQNHLCYSHTAGSCDLCRECYGWRARIDNFVQKKHVGYSDDQCFELILNFLKRYPIKGEVEFASIARALCNADNRIDTIGYRSPAGDELSQVDFSANQELSYIKEARELNFEVLLRHISSVKDQALLDYLEDLCTELFQFRYTYKQGISRSKGVATVNVPGRKKQSFANKPVDFRGIAKRSRTHRRSGSVVSSRRVDSFSNPQFMQNMKEQVSANVIRNLNQMDSLTREEAQYLVNAFVHAIHGRGNMDNLGLYVCIRCGRMSGEDWAGYDPNKSKNVNRIVHNFLYHLKSTEEAQEALNALNGLLERGGFAMQRMEDDSYAVVRHCSVHGTIGGRMPKNLE